MIAWLLAQLYPPTPTPRTPFPVATPVVIQTPAPSPLSERSMFESGLAGAQTRARKLDGTLGAVIIDLSTGSTVSLNADQSLPMQSVQKLLIAILIYRAVDAGTLAPSADVTIQADEVDKRVSEVAENYPSRTRYTLSELLALMIEKSDNTAANALLRLLGGADAANAALRALNYDGIVLDADDNGFAKPSTLGAVLSDLQNGKVLSQTSQTALLGMLAKASTFPGRLRAGFPPDTLVEHKTGTSPTVNGVTAATNDVGIVNVSGRLVVIVAMLSDARGDDAARDAVIAAVGRAVYDATRQFPI